VQNTSTVIVGQRVLLRESLAALLHDTPYRVVASAPRVSELKNVRHPTERTILVIIGLEHANDDAVSELAESVRQLRSIFPESRIVIVTESSDRADTHELMTMADAYVVNLGSRDILLKLLELALLDQRVAVLPRSKGVPASFIQKDQSLSARTLAVHDGEAPNTAGASPTRSDDPLLSPREQQILSCLAEGDSNKQIARAYNITESTVKVHLKAILRKIAAHNRTQAAIWAVERGYCHGRRPLESTEPVQHLHNLLPPSQIVNSNGGGNGAIMPNGGGNGLRKKAREP
jgi:two-component system, NarL family, nitrate/nitrite response regulator NarL